MRAFLPLMLLFLTAASAPPLVADSLASFPSSQLEPFEVILGQGEGTGNCQADETTLCLLDGAVSVRVRWQSQRNGTAGDGTVRILGERTGAFWFFRDDNLEVFVKALDGRGNNGHYWIFFGSLSDVEFWIEVVNTTSGEEKTYYNPPGNLYGVADLRALDGAPLICGGIAGDVCPDGLFCDFQDGCGISDAQGICVDLPEACPTVFDPVCGCDGNTYGNDCERFRAGVAKDHDGECEDPDPTLKATDG